KGTHTAADPGGAGFSRQTVPQLPLARREWWQARARARRGRSPPDRGSTRAAGAARWRQYARVWKECESSGDHGPRGVSRDASSSRTSSGARRFPYITSATVTLFLVALGVLYFRGWNRAWRDLPQRVWPWRLAAFAGGLAALWIAVA